MIEFASLLADNRFNNTSRCLLVLAHLGGRATTGQIIACGIAHGLRGMKGWSVSSLLSKASGRVTSTPEGWLLLEKGRRYVAESGYRSEMIAPSKLPIAEAARPSRMFIGHGRSLLWRELKDFLQEKFGIQTEEFNSTSVVGLSNKERLESMLASCDGAFLIMTAEDERSDGTHVPRMNVIHEVGLFQGRHGFTRAAVLLEDGCEEFSNIHGVGQIRFPAANIAASFEQVREFLRREGLDQPQTAELAA